MRIPLAFITGTSAASTLGTSPLATSGGPHVLEALGYHPGQGSVYFLEHYRDRSGDLPQLLRMHVRGPHIGRVIAVRSWYEGAALDPAAAPFGAREFAERLAELRQRLMRLCEIDDHDWVLRTRVIRRRALRVFPGGAPIRKYDLRLRVRSASGGPVSSIGAQTEVTAYLRPRSELVSILAVPGDRFHIAVLSYIGVPYEVGYEKQVPLLLPL